MPTYLVEGYWPGVTTERLREEAIQRGHQVISQIDDPGTHVRDIRCKLGATGPDIDMSRRNWTSTASLRAAGSAGAHLRHRRKVIKPVIIRSAFRQSRLARQQRNERVAAGAPVGHTRVLPTPGLSLMAAPPAPQGCRKERLRSERTRNPARLAADPLFNPRIGARVQHPGTGEKLFGRR